MQSDGRSTSGQSAHAEKLEMPIAVERNTSGMGFSFPRVYLDNRFVYLLLSARAGGMTIGVDLEPDKECNPSCTQCDIHRVGRLLEPRLDVQGMADELTRTLALFRGGRVRELPNYRLVPDQLLHLRHVSLVGESEPTLAADCFEAFEAVIHIRALSGFGFFKLVLMTNGAGLDQPGAQQRSLRHLTRMDEIWLRLDGGTQTYINKANHSGASLEKVLANILLLGRQRPVIIQSLFPAIHGEGPSIEEIEQYGQRLLELKNAGAQISHVQVYSATCPAAFPPFSHLSLKALSLIAKSVRQISGLKTEIS